MRRGRGGVGREASGTWVIADDHLDRVERWEQSRVRRQPVSVEILSREPVQKLSRLGALTWLDREDAGGMLDTVRDAGFGHDVRVASTQRRQWLLQENLADEIGSSVHYRSDTLAILQRRELQRVAGQLADEFGKPYVEASPGSRIEGVARKSVELTSGRFAVIERSRDFTLVPWRPVLEKQVGNTVSGIVRDSGISWAIGRGRGGPSIG